MGGWMADPAPFGHRSPARAFASLHPPSRSIHSRRSACSPPPDTRPPPPPMPAGAPRSEIPVIALIPGPQRQATMLVASLALISALAGSPPDSVPLYDNLGDFHRKVTARPIAQRYFDQGLRLYYAFNHAEAIRAFEEGARRDPRCAMCWWGAALGPRAEHQRTDGHRRRSAPAWAAITKAKQLARHGTRTERALIGALAKRYAADPTADRAALDSAYANAALAVARAYPADDDAQTLAAEAMMDLRPWNYWERDGTPQPGTADLVGMLERVMARSPDAPRRVSFLHPRGGGGHAGEGGPVRRAAGRADARRRAHRPHAGAHLHPGGPLRRRDRGQRARRARRRVVHRPGAPADGHLHRRVLSAQLPLHGVRRAARRPEREGDRGGADRVGADPARDRRAGAVRAADRGIPPARASDVRPVGGAAGATAAAVRPAVRGGARALHPRDGVRRDRAARRRRRRRSTR